MGKSPTMTAPCAAGMVRSARVMSQGNPTTTPPATSAMRLHWSRRGHGALRAHRTHAARAAATSARPSAMKVASSSRTANRVATTVPLNSSMPTQP